MGTDLDEPLIIATVTADGTGQSYPLLIDGYALPVTVRNSTLATGVATVSRPGLLPPPWPFRAILSVSGSIGTAPGAFLGGAGQSMSAARRSGWKVRVARS
jgi:hypothetical protein